jgi:hypothetical protein
MSERRPARAAHFSVQLFTGRGRSGADCSSTRTDQSARCWNAGEFRAEKSGTKSVGLFALVERCEPGSRMWDDAQCGLRGLMDERDGGSRTGAVRNESVKLEINNRQFSCIEKYSSVSFATGTVPHFLVGLAVSRTGRRFVLKRKHPGDVNHNGQSKTT